MKNKEIFLDRDGAINVDKGDTYKIEDLKIIPRVIEGLKLLSSKYKLIIITNQSGIGRSICTKQDYFYFETEQDPKLMRPTDEPVIYGDSSKFKNETGWSQEINLKQTLGDMLNYWRRSL